MILSERQKLEKELKTLIYSLNLEKFENKELLCINESELSRMFDFVRSKIKIYSREHNTMKINLSTPYGLAGIYYFFKYNNVLYLIRDNFSYKQGLAKVIEMNANRIVITTDGKKNDVYGYIVDNRNRIPDFNEIIEYFKQESIDTSMFSLDYSLRQLSEDGLTEKQIKTIVDNLLSKYVQETEIIKEDIETEEENSKTPKK